MPTSQERLIGAQFDALDKGVARRAADLMTRPTIAKQVYDEWITDLTQLSDFANQYGAVSYVNKQWTSEIPRYQQVDAAISARVVIANPANYNPIVNVNNTSTLKVSGCGCGDGIAPFTPSNYGGGGGGGSFVFGGDTLLTPSVGDVLRGQGLLPYEVAPNAPLINKSDLATQILVAVIIGGVLFALHHLTKKKKL